MQLNKKTQLMFTNRQCYCLTLAQNLQSRMTAKAVQIDPFEGTNTAR
jgi:hypothetical protein